MTKVWHLCMLNPEAVGGGDRVKESPVGAKADTSLNLITIGIKEITALKTGGQTRHRDRHIFRKLGTKMDPRDRS